MPNKKPTIAITMGDPAGVGPEVCLHFMARPEVYDFCDPIVYGDLSVLDAVAAKTGLPNIDLYRVRDFGAISMDDFEPGAVNAATGKAGYTYVDEAIKSAFEGEIDGVATAPLNKEALHQAGIKFPGHTEIFATRTETEKYCMLQYSEIISCTFVTVHCGYHEVPKLMTSERIEDVIDLSHDALVKIRGEKPKIVVLGLNPHAGENGLFGNREEEELIIPAIEKCREKGMQIEGPIPPDTAFIPMRLESSDVFICMYHDQGHIPVKALAFDKAVNTTLGLPFPRTSVDHGTALDIAWQGKANPSSLYEAVKLNAKLSQFTTRMVKPVVEPAEEPEEEVVEEPVAVANEEPVVEDNEEPVAEANEAPVAVANEEPVAEANEEPVAEANEEPVAEANEERVAITSAQPVVVTNEESAADDKDEPVAEAEDETVAKAKDETVAVAEDETVAETEGEPVAETEDETVAVAKDETVAKAKDETAAEAEDEPVAEAEDEPVAETEDEPVAETEDETVVETDDEPIADDKEAFAVVTAETTNKPTSLTESRGRFRRVYQGGRRKAHRKNCRRLNSRSYRRVYNGSYRKVSSRGNRRKTTFGSKYRKVAGFTRGRRS